MNRANLSTVTLPAILSVKISSAHAPVANRRVTPLRGTWRRMRTVYGAAARFYLGCMHLHLRQKTKRRSHLVRRTIERCVQITEADVRDIFEPLARHAALTTRQ